jgi:hypothetical protein
MGVASLMARTSIPAVDSARTALSRPDPGPFTGKFDANLAHEVRVCQQVLQSHASVGTEVSAEPTAKGPAATGRLRRKQSPKPTRYMRMRIAAARRRERGTETMEDNDGKRLSRRTWIASRFGIG